MRGRRLLLALAGIVLVAGGAIVYRTLNHRQVTAADQLTPLDVQLIQNDLNAGNAEWQVLIEASNPYLADATRIGTAQASIHCGTNTYFDQAINHATVRAVTPLKFSNNRDLSCWTSSAGPAASAS